MFSGVEDREIYEGVDSDSRLPQAEKRQGGVIAEGGGGGSTVGAKLVMGMPYFLDDHGAVVIGFEFRIKGNTKIDETVNDLDGVEGEGGERFSETPSKVHVRRAHTLEFRGIKENHDFTFGGRKSHAVLEAPELGTLDEPKKLSVGVCNETEIIDEKKNADKESDGGGGGWDGEMGENLLEGPNKVGDVETPEERGETTTFGEAFDNVNEGGRGNETMMDAIL